MLFSISHTPPHTSLCGIFQVYLPMDSTPLIQHSGELKGGNNNLGWNRIMNLFREKWKGKNICRIKIPACRSDFYQTMNITMICNNMTLVHLVRITAITQQFQVVFICTKIPSWSCSYAFLGLTAPLGLGFKLTLLTIVAFSDCCTTLLNNSPSTAFFIYIRVG